MREIPAEAADSFKHPFAVAMGRINYEHICFGSKEGFHPVFHIRCHTDGCCCQKASVLILHGIGIFLHLFDIPDGDEALQVSLFIHQRQFFNAVSFQDFLGFINGGIFRSCHQTVMGHNVTDWAGKVRLKAHIPVGNDAYQLSFFRNGNAGNMVFIHQLIRISQGIVRSQVNRIHNDAVFGTLDQLHFPGLFVDAHILMDDADTAFTSHGNGHFRFRYRIHTGTHNGDVQPDMSCELRAYVHIPGKYRGMGRNQKYIIKSKPSLAKLVCSHHSLRFLKSDFLFHFRYMILNPLI